ncbi:ABC transporter permease [Listeria sp. PSOL-1]|uniref:ABC transporter permease n=1 Tax=Listeria sp. PSOL-1 TaxID=1844999 RepID=UPI0013D5BA42|nr:ABC transporter permease [Listeria sp. PSOL-1]
MGNLIQNELIKLFKRKSSWIMQLMLVAIVFLLAMMMMSANNTEAPSTDGNKSDVGMTIYQDQSGKTLNEDQYNEAKMNDEKVNEKQLTLKETLTFLKQQKQAVHSKKEKASLQKQIDYYQAYVDAGEKPANKSLTSANFFSYLSSATSIATIFVVIVASTIVAAEFSGGTIKLLLARPYSRSQILWSKYITCFIYALLTAFVLLISSLVFSFMLPYHSVLLPIAANLGATTALSLAIQLSLSNLLLMIFYVTVAFFFSSVVRSQALAVGVGIGTLFSSSILASLLPLAIEKYDWLKWLVFNLLNLNQTVQGNMTPGELAIWQMGIGIVIYMIAILILTFTIFKKRDVALT